jgi:glycine dehydrogenase subunit 1
MRYLPQTEQNRQDMLKAIGAKNVDELYCNVPANALNAKVSLPNHMGELEVERAISKFANENLSAANTRFFLGAGCYNHHIPSTVDYIIQRSEFLTSYTPYQPEISQGTLKVIFQYQTIISNLTGMEIANASMYDGPTSTAEAALMALRIKAGRNEVCIFGNLNPEYEQTVKTYLSNFAEIKITHGKPSANTACVIVQTPDFFGEPQKLNEIRKACDEAGAMLVVAITEVLSLGLLPAPVEADIVIGDGQSIGVPMSYGGPHLGFFACRKEFMRQMPGRLCGKTVDKDGRESYTLTLSTREQHIRREKATSNICSNQGLCALAFTVHMSLLGENGFKKLAKLNHYKAVKLAESLAKVNGVKILNKTFFNEFVVELNKDAKTIVHNLLSKKIIAGLALEGNKLLVAATEVTTDEDIEVFASELDKELNYKM